MKYLMFGLKKFTVNVKLFNQPSVSPTLGSWPKERPPIWVLQIQIHIKMQIQKYKYKYIEMKTQIQKKDLQSEFYLHCKTSVHLQQLFYVYHSPPRCREQLWWEVDSNWEQSANRVLKCINLKMYQGLTNKTKQNKKKQQTTNKISKTTNKPMQTKQKPAALPMSCSWSRLLSTTFQPPAIVFV